MSDPIPPFTLRGAQAGAAAVGAIAPGVAIYGIAFGVMAAAQGLSAAEAMLFSAIVNAGGAQFASLQSWSDPVPMVAVMLTTLAMNARYLLLGATLRPWMGDLPAYQTAPSLFVMGDGNWALMLRQHEAGRGNAAFLLGSGIVLWVVWVAATLVGHLLGQVFTDPRRFGLDFFLAAFFAAMGAAFLRRRSDIAPFAVGVGVAILVDRAMTGPWSILAGALAGSLVVAARRVDPA